MGKYKEFGEMFKYGTVAVADHSNSPYEPLNKVGINWSCCGEVSIDDAIKFRDALDNAIKFAKTI